ncbi:hypothetical protein BX600DRAFT_464626 [Xylariales sp. PMI_506]|nr:hypothetical protein BX600DRAFT_464626 [Xylariales sp. PMI_506]
MSENRVEFAATPLGIPERQQKIDDLIIDLELLGVQYRLTYPSIERTQAFQKFAVRCWVELDGDTTLVEEIAPKYLEDWDFVDFKTQLENTNFYERLRLRQPDVQGEEEQNAIEKAKRRKVRHKKRMMLLKTSVARGEASSEPNSDSSPASGALSPNLQANAASKTKVATTHIIAKYETLAHQISQERILKANPDASQHAKYSDTTGAAKQPQGRIQIRRRKRPVQCLRPVQRPH